RFSHRGLSPHKFAPMLGAHPSVNRTAEKLRFSVPRPLRGRAAGYLKRVCRAWHESSWVKVPVPGL
ncbi:MAG: hypothetical protein Q8Q84_11135, partial [Hydrogenophaga sp.]|nr:hypothetical protein [Hydrogenophaga sp.]